MSYGSGALLQPTQSSHLQTSLALTVSEEMINRFCWYMQSEIREGMELSGILYTCVEEFMGEQRLQAFDTARELAERGGRVVISVAAEAAIGYRVWIDLRDWSCELA